MDPSIFLTRGTAWPGSETRVNPSASTRRTTRAMCRLRCPTAAAREEAYQVRRGNGPDAPGNAPDDVGNVSSEISHIPRP